MLYSVVIPTHNEEDCIADCLQAIKQGDEKPDELLVVDGASKDLTRSIARQFGVRVITNSLKHAAAGRNLGIQQSQGDVIVFTDADCIPRRDWLKRIKEAFAEDSELDGLGGLMLMKKPRNELEEFWAHVFLEEILPFPKESTYIHHRVFEGGFLTANCAYKRDVLQRLGGFDNWFGNHAEDIDLFWRAIDHGAKLKYVAEVIVEHAFPDSIGGIIRKNFRNGISSCKLQKRYGKRIQVDTLLYKKLLGHIGEAILRNPKSRKYIIQILSHVFGKYYGSVRLGVLNL